MDKSAIKTFAIWARNKLMSDVSNNAYLIGITKDGIQKPLPQSTPDMQYFDIGSGTPYALPKASITMRNKLVSALDAEAKQSDYAIAYRNLLEHTASTWFNRLCAIRFMEINNYFNDGLRVLSSLEEGKKDSDLMTSPFDSDLEFTEPERQQIVNWKLNNESEKLFGFLLQKKCEEIAEYLPGLFAKDEDPSALLVNFSITDSEGVLQHLIHDIEEEDWKEQVQIIGWLYQFYNTEFKDETNALLKKKGQMLTKERIPSVTQLFTPEWIVKYMVENSLGRIWIEGHPNEELKVNWKYYLEEAEQESEVQARLVEIRKEYAELAPEDLTFIDPCMGSGHILCYAFDVLMQIYESQGYTSRDAVRSVLENNLYGLDIDERAYQLAYFSIMMKARQYDHRAFRRGYTPKLYAFEESNGITEQQMEFFGVDLNDIERNIAVVQMKELLSVFKDAKEYGSILKVNPMDWALLRRFVGSVDPYGRLDIMTMDLSLLVDKMEVMINIGEILSKKYWIACTNPPYMAPTAKQKEIVDDKYEYAKADLYAVFIIRTIEMIMENGLQAMITMHGWMFLEGFKHLRNIMYYRETIAMAHLGPRAFDEVAGEVVQTTSFIKRNVFIEGYIGVYARLVAPTSEIGKETLFHEGRHMYYSSHINFVPIPGNPIAYWLSRKATEAFKKGAIRDVAETKQGFKTGNNDRFLRLWFEVSTENTFFGRDKREKKWFPCNKGGSFKKWYGNREYVVNWENDGFEIINYKNESGKQLSRPQNISYNFREALTWSTLGTGLVSFRYSDKNMMFESKGSECFARDGINLYVLQGFLNSKVAMYYLEALAPTVDYSEGSILKIPFINCNECTERVAKLVRENIHMVKRDWDAFEISWGFEKNPLIRNDLCNKDPNVCDINFNLNVCYKQWEMMCEERFQQLKKNEEELNRIFIDKYGLQDELSPIISDESVSICKANLQRDIKSLISYAVGCMLGRYSFDIDGVAFAGGEWKDVFATNYKTFIPDDDNCIPITDEDYFPDDIVGRFVEFIKVVYGEKSLEKNLRFIADAIGGNGEESREVIRKYFLKDFFKDHCKTYSVTGSGKRPIYWLFDSGNQNGFKALVYMHRWDSDTIATVRARYVTIVQEKYENELRAMDFQMEHMTDPKQKASLQRRKEKILKQVEEIKEYDELIGHLALEHIDIDLDDGVKVNHEKVQHDRNGEKFAILAPIK